MLLLIAIVADFHILIATGCLVMLSLALSLAFVVLLPETAEKMGHKLDILDPLAI